MNTTYTSKELAKHFSKYVLEIDVMESMINDTVNASIKKHIEILQQKLSRERMLLSPAIQSDSIIKQHRINAKIELLEELLKLIKD